MKRCMVAWVGFLLISLGHTVLAQTYPVIASTPEQFQAYLKAEIAKFGKLVKSRRHQGRCRQLTGKSKPFIAEDAEEKQEK